MFTIKRIYEEPSTSDGYRVLVDRLWPRGVAKEVAQLDEWLKDVAPSTELREWFGHKSEHFKEFTEKYKHELATNPAVGHLLEVSKKHKNVTLLFAARDLQINHARVLADYLTKKI